MNYIKFSFQKGFLWKWVLFTLIAFPVGAVISIITAYLVNIIYPRETNLVVGLCLGAAVGYAQWLSFRNNIPVSSKWGLFSAIGMGIPFILIVILEELGIHGPDILKSAYVSWLITGITGGFLAGFLQWRLLKPHFKKAYWWLIASPAAWGICFIAFQGIEIAGLAAASAGALVLGIISGASILWINKAQGADHY